MGDPIGPLNESGLGSQIPWRLERPSDHPTFREFTRPAFFPLLSWVAFVMTVAYFGGHRLLVALSDNKGTNAAPLVATGIAVMVVLIITYVGILGQAGVSWANWITGVTLGLGFVSGIGGLIGYSLGLAEGAALVTFGFVCLSLAVFLWRRHKQQPTE